MNTSLSHILCIDDEGDILDIVKLCLEDIGGFRVTCLLDVDSAIYKLETIKPDLILIDMMMPKIDGIKAIHIIRNQQGYQNLPIILMTARVQPKEVEEYLAKGATAVIAKPFDPMTLSDQILKIWKDL